MLQRKCVLCGSPFGGKGKAVRCPECRTRECVHCGEKFFVRDAVYPNKFCSHKCRAAHQREAYEAGFWQRVDTTGECWEWTGPRNYAGYGVLHVGGKDRLAHREAWKRTHGKLHTKVCVLHHCDNPPCVRPDHLFLGSRADNIADMTAKGRRRALSGAENGRAKLTEEAVREVRTSHARGESYDRLAVRHGVTKTNIASIVKRRIWKHVT